MRPHTRACTTCGRLVHDGGSRCPQHARPIYDAAHRSRRRMLLSQAIGTTCPLCNELMDYDQPLDLDHTTDTITHATCNRRAGARVLTGGGSPTQHDLERATVRGSSRVSGQIIA